jgi:hypothetical protein
MPRGYTDACGLETMIEDRLMTRLRLAAVLALLLAPLAAAQAPQPPADPPPVYVPTSLAAEPGLPRTRDGQPDLQGAVWAVNFFPVFEANAMAKTLVVPEAEAKKMVDMMVSRALAPTNLNAKLDPEVEHIMGKTDGLPLVRGERRTRHVVLPADGKLPIKPEIRKEAAAFDPLGGALENYESRGVGDRCLASMGQPPLTMTLSFTRLRFIQTRDHVVIHTEMGDEIRIIPFAATHKPKAEWSKWMGDGIARWEGDTLVVETIGLPKEMRIRGFSKIVVNPDSKVIERFTRLSQDELLYQWTVEDPNVYTAPWLAEFSFYRTTTGMFPSSCHEHNYSLPYILQGARVADARAEGPKK